MLRVTSAVAFLIFSFRHRRRGCLRALAALPRKAICHDLV